MRALLAALKSQPGTATFGTVMFTTIGGQTGMGKTTIAGPHRPRLGVRPRKLIRTQSWCSLLSTNISCALVAEVTVPNNGADYTHALSHAVHTGDVQTTTRNPQH